MIFSFAFFFFGGELLVIDGTLLTIVLAIVFTACQGYEYVNATFNVSDGIYGTTFYSCTGLHGFHVLVGTLFIIVCLIYLLLSCKFHHFQDYKRLLC